MPYLNIRSQDRTSTSSSSTNFTVLLKTQIAAKRFRLKAVNLPNSIYNVITGVNDSFAFIDSTTTLRTCQVPAGAYDATSLCYQIQSIMSGIDSSNNIVVTYSPVTFKISITAALVITWKTGYSLNPTIGYTLSTDLAISSGTTLSQQAVNLNPYLNMICTIQNCPTNLNSCSSLGGQFLIPFNVPRGSTMIVDSLNDYQQDLQMSSPTIFTQFVISLLYDDCSTAVNLNGLNWTMLFEYD